MTKLDILIAEDEPAQRQMLGGFLAKEGHHVIVNRPSGRCSAGFWPKRGIM